jgi:hypothetical protein
MLIQVKWAGDGDLRRVRALLADLRSGSGSFVVVARRLSPGAREALSQADVGWVDETGAAEISLPSLVVSRSGRSPEVPEREPRWSPSVFAVAEALLCGTSATVSATEKTTGLSKASCATALRTLTELGLLRADARRGRASGRRIADPDRLLDAYAAVAATVVPKAAVRVGVAWRDPVAGVVEVGTRWSRSQVAWAATGMTAAAVLAPYLTSINTADVYVDADTHRELEVVAEAAGLRPIEGGRLTLRPFPTVAVRRLATVYDDLRLAPWPRVYADLRVTGVRGEEAAEHLREVIRGS